MLTEWEPVPLPPRADGKAPEIINHQHLPPPNAAELDALPLPNLFVTPEAKRPALSVYQDAHQVYVHSE